MLRITKQADYGIVLMTYVARQGGEVVHNATDLAERAQLPAPTTTKLLKVMARAGLLSSTRGVKGGYRLAKPAESISVEEIITAIEGPIALTQCCDGGAGCEQEPHCPLQGNWRLIDRVVRQALAGISLAAMAWPLPEEDVVEVSQRVSQVAGALSDSEPNCPVQHTARAVDAS